MFSLLSLKLQNWTSKWTSSSLMTNSFRVRASDEEEEEQEMVDPQDVLREQCKSDHCQSLVDKLEACNSRVLSKKKTTETCFEEVIDFMHCVDHCASKKLFAKLK